MVASSNSSYNCYSMVAEKDTIRGTHRPRRVNTSPDVRFPTREHLSRCSFSRRANYGGRDGHYPWYIDPPTSVSRRVNSYPDVRFPTREPLSRRTFRARRMKLFLVRHAFSRRSFPASYVLFHIGLIRGMVQALDVRLSPEAYSSLQMSVQ